MSNEQNTLSSMAERAADLLETAEFVLVGIGSGAAHISYDTLAEVLKGRQYFIVTESTDDAIFHSKLLPFMIAAPLAQQAVDQTASETGRSASDPDGMSASDPAAGNNGSPDHWNAYLNWLTGTIGHSLCMLELGVNLGNAQLIRWPFERTALINQKAVLIRVNEKLPMLPEGLGERGLKVPADPAGFLGLLERQRR